MSLARVEPFVTSIVEPTLIFWLGGYLLIFLGTRSRLIGAPSIRSMPWTSAFGIPLGLGLFMRYAFELSAGNSLIADALSLLCAVAAVPAGFATLRAKRDDWRPALTPRLLSFPALWLPLAWLCVMYPVIDGDAKEIWFFHAKMIFYGKGINPGAGFQDAGVFFSHPDYPKMVPALAASIANFSGSWNDYLPKYAVALVWAPLFCFLADTLAGRRWIDGLLLLVVILSGAGFLLYNGYMDGLIAGWCAGFAGATWLMSVNHEKPDAHHTGMHGVDSVTPAMFCGLALAMILNLKFEGLPLSAILLVATVILFRPPGFRLQPFCLAAGPGLVTFTVWRLFCSRWNLLNDMASDPGAAWARFVRRVSERDSWQMIDRAFSVFFAPWWIWLPGGILIALAWQRDRRDPAMCQISSTCFSALAYAGFLVLVYMTTHHDLAWHLTFSASRTLLPAQTLILVACGFLVIRYARGYRAHAGRILRRRQP